MTAFQNRRSRHHRLGETASDGSEPFERDRRNLSRWTALAALGMLLASAASASAEPDAVQGVERQVVDVTSRAELTQKMIITRPQGATRALPAILFIPWMDCDSLAIPEAKRHGAQIILKFLVEQPGWVVGRIEKPGVGGSQGVCADTDFETELAGYQAAFGRLASNAWVAPGGIVVAAQSFSGGVVPLIAQGRPVRGYLVMSSWARTWFERLLEFERLRLVGEGTDPALLAQRMRQYSQLYATYLNERLTPGEVIARHPALTAVWDGSGTHQYGRPAQFFHQLQALNLEHAWSQVSVPTLVMWGDKDIAMHRIDHERIVSLVNANKPGAALLKIVADGGHDLAVNGQVPRDVLDAIAGWLGRIAGQQ
jgi:pimeloyl-ACP methyl ester carboxylesterase